jgi:GT2 family glycosyltransferase
LIGSTLLLLAAAIFILTRRPMLAFPLHIDTGYFVSNATIQNRRWRFRDGWSAWAAGCSKVIPEMFYSFVYLMFPRSYTKTSRIAYMLLCGATSLAFGRLVAVSGGNGYVGVLVFMLLLSEPHYGTLYESCEQFELVFYVLALLLLAEGHFLLAAAILWLGVFFVKLSGGMVAGAILLWSAAVLGFPGAIALLAPVLACGALYLGWILANGQDPKKLLETLRAQQKILALPNRLKLKAELLWQIWSYWPLLPLAAIAGALVHPSGMMLVFLAGVIGAYLIQGNRVWYYSIPFIPIIAYFASMILNPLAAAVLAAAWIALYLRRLPGNGMQRYFWVWRLHNEMGQAKKNAEIAFECGTMPKDGRRPFVFGHETQIYSLLGTAYPTPLISGAWFVDHMSPGWSSRMARQMVDDPPEMLIDTTGNLRVDRLQKRTGLEYVLERKRTMTVYGFKEWKPRASAIVSAYFCADYLEGRIENLLGQSMRPEIVVVCGEWSREEEIASQLLEPGRDVILATKGEVPTIYDAWNRGIQASHGEYITNANADDRLSPGALLTLARTLDDHPEAALVYPDCEIFEGDRRIGGFRFAEGGWKELMNLCFIGPMPMWRRSLHDKHGWFDEKMQSAGDYEFWLRIAKAGEKLLHVRDILGIYLKRPDSAEHRDPGIGARETAEARRRYANR